MANLILVLATVYMVGVIYCLCQWLRHRHIFFDNPIISIQPEEKKERLVKGMNILSLIMALMWPITLPLTFIQLTLKR